MARPSFNEAADATPSVCGLCGALVGDEDIHIRAHEDNTVPTDRHEPVVREPQPPAPAGGGVVTPPHGPDRPHGPPSRG